MSLGTFFAFLAVLIYLLMVVGGLIEIPQKKKLVKFIAVCRLCIVLLTIAVYIDVFVNSFDFQDVQNPLYNLLI